MDQSTGKSPAFRDVFDLEAPPEIHMPNVVAVVLCHNEALRLPYFLEHHKAAGIERFLVVDNMSDDGSTEILEADDFVTRIPSSRSYQECKSLWRELLADHYLADRWALFLDVDELFVYPGWPAKSLPEYCKNLEKAGHNCLLSFMVDMYPAAALSECRYVAGAPFLDAAPYFDTGNYRIEAYPARQLQDWPTPPVHLRGGARERLFQDHVIHDDQWLDRTLINTVFSIGRGLNPGPLRRKFDSLAGRYINRHNTGLGLPNMSKVALFRWRPGCRFNGGVHRISEPMQLAPDVATLLHFKYFDDFGDRARYSVARGQHVKGAAHYKLYARSDDVLDQPIKFNRSRKFERLEDLIKEGLMRDVIGRRK